MDTPRTACLVAIASVALIAGCGSKTGPVVTDSPLDQREETAHGIYLFSAGDAVDTLFQEVYYVWLFNQLGVTPPDPIVYHKYQNLQHIETITGRFTDAYTETGTLSFHTIWAADNHQSVHAVVTTMIGHPPSLINEGLATAHQTDPFGGDLNPRWEGVPIDDIARFAIQGGDIPELDDLMASNTAFFNYDRNLVFPLAGSFVHFLLNDFGYQPVLDLAAQTDYNATAAQVRATYESILGEPIDSSWARWKRILVP